MNNLDCPGTCGRRLTAVADSFFASIVEDDVILDALLSFSTMQGECRVPFPCSEALSSTESLSVESLFSDDDL